jgi:hypothetical protein
MGQMTTAKKTATKEPVKAVVVKDQTKSWRTRVPIIALIMVILYVLVADRVQSADNGSQLDRASKSISHLTDSQAELLRTVHRDEGYVILASAYIQELRKLHKEQNRRLKSAGLQPVPLPPAPEPPKASTNNAKSARESHPQPKPEPSPSESPSHHPSPKPSPSPSSSPKPHIVPTCLEHPLKQPLKCIQGRQSSWSLAALTVFRSSMSVVVSSLSALFRL